MWLVGDTSFACCPLGAIYQKRRTFHPKSALRRRPSTSSSQWGSVTPPSCPGPISSAESGARSRTRLPRFRAENDWTAAQVARFRDRLAGFCSFNPLKSYALDELDRCMRDPRLSDVKLHFTTSGIDLRNPEHVAHLRAVFRVANARRFPIVVHMRTLNPAYGRRDAEVFLNRHQRVL